MISDCIKSLSYLVSADSEKDSEKIVKKWQMLLYYYSIALKSIVWGGTGQWDVYISNCTSFHSGQTGDLQ